MRLLENWLSVFCAEISTCLAFLTLLCSNPLLINCYPEKMVIFCIAKFTSARKLSYEAIAIKGQIQLRPTIVQEMHEKKLILKGCIYVVQTFFHCNVPCFTWRSSGYYSCPYDLAAFSNLLIQPSKCASSRFFRWSFLYKLFRLQSRFSSFEQSSKQVTKETKLW